MKPSQIAIAVAAAIAVGAVAIIAGVNGGGGGSGGGGKAAAKNALKVSFVYSPEKEKLLGPLIERFNSRQEKVGGRPVFVEGENAASGDAESKIARGRLKPVAWTPSSSLWGRLLDYEADQPYAARDNPSIVRTPLVIAMWEPFAKALGWPKKKIGFAQIIRLARSNQGFAAYGKPQYGRFKLVHTNPDFSTSGLSAVVAEYYAAIGKKEGLTARDVTTSHARAVVKDIERSIVHYGDTTLFIADEMRKGGPGYASAVAMEEATLLDFNRHRGSQPRLIALYPPEGTFYSDNPFIVLNAPWVSGAQKRGAEAFQTFLADQITPELAARYGFRPADLNKKPVAPINQVSALPVVGVLCALLCGCGGSSGSGAGGGASATKPAPTVRLALDFTPNAAHAPIYAAVRTGADRKHGIHLEILEPGAGTPDSLKVCGAKPNCRLNPFPTG